MQYSVSPRRDLQQLRTEPERKREDAHAEPPRRQEMTELVHEDEHAEHEQEREEGVHLQECPFSRLRRQF